MPLGQLAEKAYAALLCYPKVSEDELQRRLEELHNLGVSAVEFSGKASAFGVSGPILGKGYVGIVIIAHLDGQRVAMKILRVDADRPDMMHEAQMLAKANTADVGPTLIGASKNFLLMQFINGDLFPAWLKANKEKALVRNVLGEVLENCYRLDKIGLDHGELSKAPKHVIIDCAHKPWIVDFETASDARKPANITAICHFLFSSAGEVARTVADVLGERDREEIVKTLQQYKKCRSRESFDRVLQVCLS